MASLFGTLKSECSGFAVVVFLLSLRGRGRQQNKERAPQRKPKKSLPGTTATKKGVSATTAKNAPPPPPNDSGEGFCLLSLRGHVFLFAVVPEAGYFFWRVGGRGSLTHWLPGFAAAKKDNFSKNTGSTKNSM